MTAFLLCPYPDRVEILSDGAAYKPDGTLIGASYKVTTSDVVPLAIVGSGTISETSLLAIMILAAAEATGSVDDTISLLAHSLNAVRPRSIGGTGLRMAIGAISETRGPVCFVFSTFSDPASGVPAFTLQDMPRAFAQGAAPTGEDLAAYGPVSIGNGLEKDAAFLFGSMRCQKMINPAAPDREPFHSVGAHVDLTVIRADGYEKRRLLTWPDVIGEKINPKPPEDPGIPFDDGSTFDDGTGWE
ncbi:hypothetical protein QBK93_17450 [Rhizobium leguminosarum]|uniref:hypothetical protein n=1 Tax=Rhizobium leguminosarum TaxID=384 RepID=UPI0024A8E7A2|nr:hypothetical protein [Rhizobium leguminosarum]MDI5926465.1 hypothetical protein [Rhizobium leguminosarum]